MLFRRGLGPARLGHFSGSLVGHFILCMKWVTLSCAARAVVGCCVRQMARWSYLFVLFYLIGYCVGRGMKYYEVL